MEEINDITSIFLHVFTLFTQLKKKKKKFLSAACVTGITSYERCFINLQAVCLFIAETQK